MNVHHSFIEPSLVLFVLYLRTNRTFEQILDSKNKTKKTKQNKTSTNESLSEKKSQAENKNKNGDFPFLEIHKSNCYEGVGLRFYKVVFIYY